MGFFKWGFCNLAFRGVGKEGWREGLGRVGEGLGKGWGWAWGGVGEGLGRA